MALSAAPFGSDHISSSYFAEPRLLCPHFSFMLLSALLPSCTNDLRSHLLCWLTSLPLHVQSEPSKVVFLILPLDSPCLMKGHYLNPSFNDVCVLFRETNWRQKRQPCFPLMTKKAVYPRHEVSTSHPSRHILFPAHPWEQASTCRTVCQPSVLYTPYCSTGWEFINF